MRHFTKFCVGRKRFGVRVVNALRMMVWWMCDVLQWVFSSDSSLHFYQFADTYVVNSMFRSFFRFHVPSTRDVSMVVVAPSPLGHNTSLNISSTAIHVSRFHILEQVGFVVL